MFPFISNVGFTDVIYVWPLVGAAVLSGSELPKHLVFSAPAPRDNNGISTVVGYDYDA